MQNTIFLDSTTAMMNQETSIERGRRLKMAAKLIFEIVIVIIGFRLLDRISYYSLVWLGALPEKPAVTMQLVFSLSTISTVMLTLTVIILQKIRGKSLSELGLSKATFPTIKNVIVIALCALAFQILMGQAIDPLLEWAFAAPKSLPVVPSFETLLLGYAVSFIGGGFREELFFRGYLISRIRGSPFFSSHTAFSCAVVFQATLFGISHWYQGPAGIIGTTLLGLGFTAAYLKTKSLWAAILFHGFFDVFGFSAIYLSQ